MLGGRPVRYRLRGFFLFVLFGTAKVQGNGAKEHKGNWIKTLLGQGRPRFTFEPIATQTVFSSLFFFLSDETYLISYILRRRIPFFR